MTDERRAAAQALVDGVLERDAPVSWKTRALAYRRELLLLAAYMRENDMAPEADALARRMAEIERGK
jgi:hypothetical protein